MRGVLTWLCCVLAVPGCSYAFVDKAPPNHAQLTHFDCTSGKAAPVLDTLGAGFEVVRTGVALAASDSQYADYPISRGADIAFGVGLATLLTASAIYGFSNTSECSEAKEELESRAHFAAPAYQPAPTAPPGAGCFVDTQCKGDRVCEHGQCVQPPPPPPIPMPPAPIALTPSAAPPASPPAAPSTPAAPVH